MVVFGTDGSVSETVFRVYVLSALVFDVLAVVALVAAGLRPPPFFGCFALLVEAAALLVAVFFVLAERLLDVLMIVGASLGESWSDPGKSKVLYSLIVVDVVAERWLVVGCDV